MLSADTQKIIVGFLNGEKIAKKNVIDLLELRGALEGDGYPFSRMFEANAESLNAKTVKSELDHFLDNGMPARCVNCRYLKAQAHTYLDYMDNNVTSKFSLSCDNSGCQLAKEEFVANLKDKDIARIGLVAEVAKDSSRNHWYEDESSLSSYPTSPRKSMTLKVYELGSEEHEAFIEKERHQKFLEEQARRKAFEARRRKEEIEALEREKRELEEIVKMEANKPNNDFYGVDAW